MKKFFVFCCFIWIAGGSLYSITPGAAFDAGFIQDVLITKSTVQADMDLRLSVNENLEIRIPVSADFKTDNFLIESGMDVVCYPWNSGFFAGMSAFRFGWVKNAVADISFFSLNELMIGWTFSLSNGFFAEPSLAIRNPSRTQNDDYSALLGEFPNYGTFRFKAKFGWKYFM